MQTDLIERSMRVVVISILFGLAVASAAGAGTLSLEPGVAEASWAVQDEAAGTPSIRAIGADDVSMVTIGG